MKCFHHSHRDELYLTCTTSFFGIQTGLWLQTVVIIRKISPLFRPFGTYYPDNDHRSVHYPLLIWCSQKLITLKVRVRKKASHSVSFYSLFVTVHGIFQQRIIVCRVDDKDVEQNSRSLEFKSSNQSVKLTWLILCFLFGSCRSSSILSTSLSS